MRSFQARTRAWKEEACICTVGTSMRAHALLGRRITMIKWIRTSRYLLGGDEGRLRMPRDLLGQLERRGKRLPWREHLHPHKNINQLLSLGR